MTNTSLSINIFNEKMVEEQSIKLQSVIHLRKQEASVGRHAVELDLMKRSNNQTQQTGCSYLEKQSGLQFISNNKNN